jgi:uncharacterized protein (TIGR02001 family)
MRLAALLLLAFASRSFAADGFGGALAITSDYVFRGISQSNGQPALQGDIHYSSPRGWLAGVWASTVELNPLEGRTSEVDAYAGYRWLLGADWSAKLTGVHYDYPQNSQITDYDYNEVIGSLGFRDNLFFNVAWAFDASRYYTSVYAKNQNALSYEVAAEVPLRFALVAQLGVGRYEIPSLTGVGYSYWNAGIRYQWRAWHASVSYIGTSRQAEELFFGHVAGDRVAATLMWRF